MKNLIKDHMSLLYRELSFPLEIVVVHSLYILPLFLRYSQFAISCDSFPNHPILSSRAPILRN